MITNIQEFISRNKLVLRSQEEIVERIRSGSSDVEGHVLFPLLDAEHAKELVRKGAFGDEDGDRAGLVDVVMAGLAYMRLLYRRSLSSNEFEVRNGIQTLSAWLWVMGRDDLPELIERSDLYHPYGAPALVAVCDAMGIEVPEDFRDYANYFLMDFDEIEDDDE